MDDHSALNRKEPGYFPELLFPFLITQLISAILAFFLYLLAPDLIPKKIVDGAITEYQSKSSIIWIAIFPVMFFVIGFFIYWIAPLSNALTIVFRGFRMKVIGLVLRTEVTEQNFTFCIRKVIKSITKTCLIFFPLFYLPWWALIFMTNYFLWFFLAYFVAGFLVCVPLFVYFARKA